MEIVIPVFNEEAALAGAIAVLHAYLTEWLPFDWLVTIVDNGSTDLTREVAHRLAGQLPGVRVLCLDFKGKGNAISTAWSASEADIVAYMDVDLSTHLDALLPMLTALASGHSDLAIGSRLMYGANMVRSLKRDVVSRCYNGMLRLTHGVRFSDAQCGFKAGRTSVVRPLLRQVQDRTWFFDTELLLLAEHNGLRVLEVPVDWVEDRDSRVAVARVALINLGGMLRCVRVKATGRARVPGLPVRGTPQPIHPAAVVRPKGRHRLAGDVAGFAAVSALCVAAAQESFSIARWWWPPTAAALLAALLAARIAAEIDWLLPAAAQHFAPRQRWRGLLGSGLVGALVGGTLLAFAAPGAAADPSGKAAALLAVTALGVAARLAVVWPVPSRRIPR